jgi:antitoxin component of RelBE/YafQ-DinJ toxin-antitoxin module
MTTLTVNIDDQIKSQAQKKTEKDGVTLTFVVNQCLKAYASNEMKFKLMIDHETTLVDDETIYLTKEIEKQLAKKVNFDKLPSLKEQLARLNKKTF